MTCSNDERVCCLSERDFSNREYLTHHQDQVYSMVFADGQLITGACDRKLVFLDLKVHLKSKLELWNPQSELVDKKKTEIDSQHGFCLLESTSNPPAFLAQDAKENDSFVEEDSQ